MTRRGGSIQRAYEVQSTYSPTAQRHSLRFGHERHFKPVFVSLISCTVGGYLLHYLGLIFELVQQAGDSAALKLTLLSCTVAAVLSVWVGTPLGYILARFSLSRAVDHRHAGRHSELSCAVSAGNQFIDFVSHTLGAWTLEDG